MRCIGLIHSDAAKSKHSGFVLVAFEELAIQTQAVIAQAAVDSVIGTTSLIERQIIVPHLELHTGRNHDGLCFLVHLSH